MKSLAQGHTAWMGFGQDSKQAGWIPGLSFPLLHSTSLLIKQSFWSNVNGSNSTHRMTVVGQSK